MGAALVRSAFSPNIKERRDCWTAIFDAGGRMVAQAEHIPVHLGAMPHAVATVLELDPGPREIWILNDPYEGGTHLPDITLVSRTPLGFAATRAHHADVGGAEPGSLAAGSRTLAEEGIVIPPTRLDDAVLEELVSRMRNPDERRGDLAPSRGAAARGPAVGQLIARHGRGRLAAAMDELVAYAERRVEPGSPVCPPGARRRTMVEARAGTPVPLNAQVGDEVEVDFAGTSRRTRATSTLAAVTESARASSCDAYGPR